MLFVRKAIIGSTLLCIVLGMTLSLGARADNASDAGPRFFEKSLENGLKIIVKVDRRAPVAVSMVWYRVGSIDEVSGTTGVSHVVEHMMFKGTANAGPGEFSSRIARAGGRSNAFTSRDYTAYYEQLPKSQLALAFALEADRMARLTIDPGEFSKEIRVVMEERRLRIADNPQALVMERLLAAAFIAHPYRTPVIGWMGDLRSLQASDVRDWYAKWYAPGNATIVVVGDVDPQEVFALAQTHFGALASTALPVRKAQTEPEQLGIRRVHVRAPAQMPYIAMAYHVPALRDIDKDREPYALSVLSGVLDGYAAARLNRELVRNLRVADSVDVSYDGYARGPGLFYVSGTPAAGKTTGEFESAWRQQIDRLVRDGIDENELRRVKAQVVSGYVYQRDSIFGQATQIGRLNSIGLPYDSGGVIVQRLQEVTAEEVREVARKYLIDVNLTIAVLDPESVPGADAGSAEDANDTSR